MDHGVEAVAGKQRLHPRDVADVARHQAEAVVLLSSGQVRALQSRIVKRIEVVEHGDAVTALEQALRDVRADEAGAAGDEDVHRGMIAQARCYDSAVSSLFTDPASQRALTPLAERVRPRTLAEVVGQDAIVDILRELIQRKALPSLILWGPPGCGKTTIARLLAGERYAFVQLSAVLAGVRDVREQIEQAKQRRRA